MNSYRGLVSPGSVVLWAFLLCGFAAAPDARGEWQYLGDTRLLANADFAEAGLTWGLYQGTRPWGVGWETDALFDTRDEKEFRSVLLGGFEGGGARYALGAGAGQTDSDIGIHPRIELSMTTFLGGNMDLTYMLSQEIDGAGIGIAAAWSGYAELAYWLDLQGRVELEYTEETEEDVDGFLALLLEPMQRYDQVHVGLGISLDEEHVETGVQILYEF